MNKVRVVVVDDSPFMRKLLSDMINKDSNLQVVAQFRNGKELIEKIDDIKPDIITLDLEMPILNGLDTLRELKKRNKKENIIILSSLAGDGSKHTIECLEYGAIDFIEKPYGGNFLDIYKIEKLLISKIYAIIENKVHVRKSIKKHIESNGINYRNKSIDVLLIGASTGGPKALQEILSNINIDIGIPILVVQHMPKGFTKAFAERLNSLCKLRIVEAVDKMALEKNTVYIAQGGFHMTVDDRKNIRLNEDELICGVRPSINKLFESAVKVYGSNILSVILTGMGRDGAYGTELVKDSGGITIAEDESTCVIYGMPKAAYETGKVDIVLPLSKIGQEITSIVRRR